MPPRSAESDMISSRSSRGQGNWPSGNPSSYACKFTTVILSKQVAFSKPATARSRAPCRGEGVWRPQPGTELQCRRLRPAIGPVEQFDRVHDRHAGAVGDLGDAADIAGRNHVGAGRGEVL